MNVKIEFYFFHRQIFLIKYKKLTYTKKYKLVNVSSKQIKLYLMLKVLVVEDEVELLELYDLILSKNYKVFTTDSGREAINIIDRENPEILIVDIRLPDLSGIEVTKYAKAKNLNVVVIGVSAYRERFKEAIDAGAATVIQKPFLIKQIHEVIEGVLQKKQKSF